MDSLKELRQPLQTLQLNQNITTYLQRSSDRATVSIHPVLLLANNVLDRNTVSEPRQDSFTHPIESLLFKSMPCF